MEVGAHVAYELQTKQRANSSGIKSEREKRNGRGNLREQQHNSLLRLHMYRLGSLVIESRPGEKVGAGLRVCSREF